MLASLKFYNQNLFKTTMLTIGGSDLISVAEDILWHQLPSNASILGSLQSRKLKHQNSLAEMRSLLAALGHEVSDLDRLKIVHITGSKGKGSTAAFVESIMRQHGLSTALFTSPHLVHPRERLSLNGHSMDLTSFSKAVVSTYDRLKNSQVKQLPGFFRFMTLMAFDHMLQLQKAGTLDVAIIEVGMGGRYDCTNIIEQPIATAITFLSMEHVQILGPSLIDIANHKVGIAKPGVPLISVPQSVKVIPTIIENAQTIGAKLSFVESLDTELPRYDNINLGNLIRFSPNFIIGIEGEHQRLNAALAVRIFKAWWERQIPERPFSFKAIVDGLESVRWPGRHQVYRDDKNLERSWYLDGAHTIESVEYATKWFTNHLLPNSQAILLFHCTHDRSLEALLGPLVTFHKHVRSFSQVLFVKPQSPVDSQRERAMPDLTLHEQMATYWTSETNMAATAVSSPDLLRTILVGNTQLLVTGSLYLVGEVMRLLCIPIN